jgi:DNA-binding GntR family transcriptional regulator
LAERLGISRAPVREALRDLAARGFFDIVRNKGYRLRGLGAKEIRDLYQFRRMVERAVLEDIAVTLTKAALQQLDTLIHESAATRDTLRYLELDRRFHSYIVSLTENAFVISAFESLMDMRDWVSAKTLLVRDHMEASRREHVEILRMLKRRNAPGAADAMEKHLTRAEQGALASLSQRGSGGHAVPARSALSAQKRRGAARAGGGRGSEDLDRV